MSNVQFPAVSSLKKLKLCLPKVGISRHTPLDYRVPCFGCSVCFPSEDECAEHILHHCLRIRSSRTDETIRFEVIKWITEYYRNRRAKNNSQNVEKMYFTRETCCNQIATRKCLDLQIILTPIPKEFQCPVCKLYFSSSKICCRHLFRCCLFTEDFADAVTLRKWLSQYSWNNENKSNSEKCNLDNENVSVFSEDISCKYCHIMLADKKRVKEHFVANHLQINNIAYPVCSLCNFKAFSKEKLVKHFIVKHVKCGCGFTTTNYPNKKEHLSLCKKKHEAVCPVCKEIGIDLFNTDSEFGEHLITCKGFLPINIKVDDLFFECDVCQQTVLQSDADDHLANHFKLDNSNGLLPQRIFLKLSDIKGALSEAEFEKLKTAC